MIEILKGLVFQKNKNIALYCYAIFMSGLHFIRLLDNSFWGDEGIVVAAARKTTSIDMLKHIAGNGHSPFHFAFAWLCVQFFGESGFIYHLSAALPFFW